MILPERVMVEEIITYDGVWDIRKVAYLISVMGVKDVLSIPLALFNVVEKKRPSILGLFGNSKFSIGFCYLRILKSEGIITPMEPNWTWLWKLILSIRIIQFFWLLKFDRIHHNQICVRRDVLQTSSCKHIGLEESVNHLFYACPLAGKVWCLILRVKIYDP